MRKYARKVAKSVPPARLSRLTTQIEVDLAQDLPQARHDHFAHWRRCERSLPLVKTLKILVFPADLRLSSEQIVSCHFGLSL